MSDPRLDVQIDAILRSIRRSHSRNMPFHVEVTGDNGAVDLSISGVPDGLTWLMAVTGRVSMDLTPVVHAEVIKTCSQILRIAFDAKWRSKAALEFKKAASN